MSQIKRRVQMMAVKSHDDAVRELYVVSGVHSAGGPWAVSWTCVQSSTSDASGAIVDAAHSNHLAYSSHAALFDLAHITMTLSYTSVHLEIVSRQHVHAHLGMVAALKFAIVVSPACGHTSFDVVN